MIPTSQVREAIAWIERAGVTAELEAILRPTGRGRPRQLSVRALLVGIKLAIDDAKTSCLTDVHRMLTEQLSSRDQRELGVQDPRTQQVVTLHQVRRLFATLSRALDPARQPDPSLSDHSAHTRAAALQSVLDRLLAATMPETAMHRGAYAVDGTGIWSWSRGKRRTQRSADPDAAWGSKTAKSGGQEPYFGYELHAVVRVNARGQDPADVPCLAERIVVVPAATNCVTAVTPALARLHAEGTLLREVVADRGYTYKTNWTRELFALGIDPVLDLHQTQYGARGTHQGARIITGVPHCPSTPTPLDTIHRPERLADTAELDVFLHQIARRENWAFRRVAGPDETGKERYECPARAAKVRCPLHRPSLAQPLRKPTVINPPQDTPPCCAQRTITVPGDVDPKSRQRHYWGSREWISAFRRPRVEGWFGNIKNNSTEALSRGAFRVMGLAKTSIMLGIYAAATNLRILRAWTSRRDDQPTNTPPGRLQIPAVTPPRRAAPPAPSRGQPAP